MKKINYLWLVILGLIVIVAAVIRLSSPEDEWVCKDGQWVRHGQPSSPRPSTVCPGGEDDIIGTPTGTSTATSTNDGLATFGDQVLVTRPKQNEVVKSPLIVEGQAVGPWFFEASFPVVLTDASGTVISTYHATAQEDWMTEKPVKFRAVMEFQTSAKNGFIILKKDNPSGLPENDASLSVPVRFQ